ncbi:MAG: DUF3368 domain-containing protein [Dehalococcoidia bacterium]
MICAANSLVAEPPAVDASPIILLAKAGLLSLLKQAGDAVVVPRAVAQEVARRGRDDVAVQSLRATQWLTIIRTPSIPREIRQWRLHRGESAVLAWARSRPGCEAILDDLTARRCAEALRIPGRGTPGLVLTATRRGAVPLARPLVDQLLEAGLYLSRNTIDQALVLVGE